MCGELFTYVCKPQNPWLSYFYFPKYYKVFINKKKYKAHARASVFVFKYPKQKQQIKRK